MQKLGKEGWEDVQKVLYKKDLLYIPKIVRTELINKFYDDLLVGYFGIKKTLELIAQKYYWSTLRTNVNSNNKRCNVCLASN